METEPGKKISRREFVGLTGLGLFTAGISSMIWGGMESTTIKKQVKQQIGLPDDTLAQARRIKQDAVTIFEYHARKGTLGQLTDDINEKKLQEAIQVEDKALKQMFLESKLRSQKHVNEKKIIGFIVMILGVVTFTASE